MDTDGPVKPSAKRDPLVHVFSQLIWTTAILRDRHCAGAPRQYDSGRMTAATLEEAWLRGPVDGIPPLLMPCAHALVQAQEDVQRALDALTTDQIWLKPGGAASVGFHARHLAGALDRLFTYARGEALNDTQRKAAVDENRTVGLDAGAILAEVTAAVTRAMAQLRATAEPALLEPRAVGRKQLPSNVLGLLSHAAEHTTRHAGQAITTARILAGTGPA